MTKSRAPLNWVTITQILLIVNAITWLAFGVVSLLRLGSGNPELVIGLAIVAVLMFGNAGAMAVSAVLLPKRRTLFYLFALAVILTNILLTFTDQFGLFDFLTLVVDLVILGILVGRRGLFIGG